MSDEEKLYEAWRGNPEWRHMLISELTREISKHGDMSSYIDVLVVLSKKLNPHEITDLYSELQESRRPDFEWRPQFLQIFSAVSESDLPAPVISREEAERIAAEYKQQNGTSDDYEFPDEIPY